MSGPFGGQPRENVFGQHSAQFGQGFSSASQTVFGGQQSSAMLSGDDSHTKQGTSANLFAPTTSSSGAGVFGAASSSSGNPMFGGINSTASGQNLFAQFSPPASAGASFAFSGGSAFGGAKLFGTVKGSKSTPAVSAFTTDSAFSTDSVFTTDSPSTMPRGATSSNSLESGLVKDSKQKELFGNLEPIETHHEFGTTSAGFSSETSTGRFGKDTTLVRCLFTKEKEFEGSTAEESLPVHVTDRHAISTPSVAAEESKQHFQDIQVPGGENILFGKPQKATNESTSPSRKPLIKRADRDRSGLAARSIFSKALSGATGKSRAPKERQDDGQTAQPSKSSQGRKNPEKFGESHSSRRLSQTLSPGDEISNKVALVCKDVPSSKNTVMQLRKHFNKFGNVTKVYPSPAKRSAIVHFKTHDDAVTAKKRGRVILRGQAPLQIFWSSYSLSTATAANKSGSLWKSGSSSRTGPSVRGRSEVEDELASMAGTSDTDNSSSYKMLHRPGEVAPQELSPQKRQIARQTHSPARSLSPTPAGSSSENATKTTSSTVTKVSIESLMTPAKNSLDMYVVLDNRDKIMKQGRRKQSDLKTAKAVQGTCPDMCYEKERYDRDAKRRLTIFEMIPGTENLPGQNPKVDHIRAVKEYSRSSADQEEPLPHEMRPGPVLDMTMTYLLTEIADKGDETLWMDWFDFLWNRTRGIRKDITQQMLCDKTAVALIEKCARFHIYCAERLCEEDSHTFDQKINTENLTKSLQSLKELYSDLAIKQQVFCDTEAEFRAYMVLLNLNEGDTLREVQQLRNEVRASPEINFALQVYSALNSNNYVRFFKLAKKASFLNACIMHRYFVQVRSRALKTMLRAFSISGRPIQYPLIELVRVLAFEDTEEAAVFCMHYGLSTKAGEVQLNKRMYIEPEVGLSLIRALSVIESKLTVSVGEVINGSPLPPLNLPPPQISFDEKGRYIGEIPRIEAPAKEVEKTVHYSVLPSVVQEHVEELPARPKQAVPNEFVKEIARQLFWETIDEFSHEISTHCYEAIHSYLDNTSAEIWSSVYQEVSAPIIQSVCETELENERAKKQKEVAIATRIAQRERDARAEMEIMINEVVHQEVTEISVAEVRGIRAKLKEEQIARCAESLCEELLEETVQSVVQDVAENVYQEDVVQRLEELSELEDCVQLYRTSKFWHIWKKMYSCRLRLKRSMLTFPCAPSTDHITDQVDALIPGRGYDKLHQGAVYMNDTAKLHVLGPLIIDEKQRQLDGRISLHHLVERLKHHVAWSPLNLAPVIGKQLLHTLQSQTKQKLKNNSMVYWKLVISLPEVNESDYHGSLFCEWLLSKFTKGPVPELDETSSKVETLSLYTSPLRFPQQPVSQLAACVKVVNGHLDNEEVELLKETYSLLGSSAMILVLYPLEMATLEFWRESKDRLLSILHAKPIKPGLPLTIVLVDATEMIYDLEVYAMLSIASLIGQGYLSAVNLIRMDWSPLDGVDILLRSTTSKVEEGIRWLSEHYPALPKLQSKPLFSLIEETLSAEFYIPVFRNLKQRKQEGRLHQAPRVLIGLYNYVIAYLQNAVTMSSLKDYSWPVSEFSHSHSDLPKAYWNSELHMEYLEEIFQDLRLPDLTILDIKSGTWVQGCADVQTYMDVLLFGKLPSPEYTQFLSQVRWLLKKIESEFGDSCFLVEGNTGCAPTYANIPWTDIIMAAVEYNLASLNMNNPDLDIQEMLVVHYQMPDLTFVPPLFWKMAQSDRRTLDGTLLKYTMRQASEKRQLEKNELSDDHSEAKRTCLNCDRQPFEEDYGTVPKERLAIGTSKLLLQELAMEKKESNMFEDFLQKALTPDICMSTGEQCKTDSFSNCKTLREGFNSLEQQLASEKLAYDLFEMKLRNTIEFIKGASLL